MKRRHETVQEYIQKPFHVNAKYGHLSHYSPTACLLVSGTESIKAKATESNNNYRKVGQSAIVTHDETKLGRCKETV